MGKGDFVISSGESPIRVLHRHVPEFFTSAEYNALGNGEKNIVGVVCGAFARYLMRIETQRAGTPSGDGCYRAIEQLAEHGVGENANYVVTEIFENLDCPEDILTRIKNNLGPGATALFYRWIVD